jgi:hypothetical protein
VRTPGQVAYEDYYETSYGIQLLTGVRLPIWRDQLPEVQESWEAAALAVLQLRGKEETSEQV